jgi:hypothetical protein
MRGTCERLGSAARDRPWDETGAPDRAHETLPTDDEHARRVRLLLLGNGAVLAHRFDLRLAAEMDE